MELTFFILICCKKLFDVCLKRLKKTKKRPGLAHFLTVKIHKLYFVTLYFVTSDDDNFGVLIDFLNWVSPGLTFSKVGCE